MKPTIERAASDESAARELEELLRESGEAARARVAAVSASIDDRAISLYGAGTLGREVLAKLRRAGVEPVAFADDTPEKQGQTVEGVRVMRPREVFEQYGDEATFVVTILNPALRYREAKRRLETALRGARVVSFVHLAWKYAESFLPFYQFELPDRVLSKADEIRRAFQLFEDAESRRQFVRHLRFRLRLEHDALPANLWDNYFPPDVPLDLSPETTFVDCGAYDGDTVRFFLEHQGGRFREIFAFEPDEENCRRLSAYVSTLPEDAARRVHVHRAGVGREYAKLKFHATGNMSASLASGGETEVDVVPVAEMVGDVRGAEVYVKYDTEGAEWEALAGTRRLIEEARTTLAVSIYHRPDDLWQLPLFLKSLDGGYRLFLRTQGEDGMDVICYALPPARRLA